MKTMQKVKRVHYPHLSREADLKMFKEYAGSISHETADGMLAEVKKIRRESEARMKKLDRLWQSYGTKNKKK